MMYMGERGVVGTEVIVARGVGVGKPTVWVIWREGIQISWYIDFMIR